VDPRWRWAFPATERQAGRPRQNPYYFLKATSATSRANGDPIILPPGRTQIDWECELTSVIGKTATRVKGRAGRRVHLRLHARQRRSRIAAAAPTGRHGSDWVLGKSHDTFYPMGPYIVRGSSWQTRRSWRSKFSLSGKLMQDSNTDRDDPHRVRIGGVRLAPADAEAGRHDLVGSPAGVGTARARPSTSRTATLRPARSNRSARSKTPCGPSARSLPRRSRRTRRMVFRNADFVFFARFVAGFPVNGELP